MIRVAIIQRTCMHYRIPVFQRIGSFSAIDLTVLFGNESPIGILSRRSKQSPEVRYIRTCTVPIRVKHKSKVYYLPIFPTLPFFFMGKRYDVIVTEGTTNLLNNFVIYFLCKIRKAKFVWWDSGSAINSCNSGLRRYIEPVLTFLVRRADACIGYSSLAKRYFLNKHVDCKKIFVAQNTIDNAWVKDEIDRFASRISRERQIRGWEKKTIILYAGAVEERKRVGDLMRAYSIIKKDIPDTVLLIVGDGPDRGRLQKLCIDLQLGDVYFLGSIYEEIVLYYLLSDVCVLPGEGGLSVNLAMACGIPVITTSADGTIADLISDGINGYIFSEGNVIELANKLKRILKSKKLQKQFASLSWARIHTEFSIETMVSNIMEAILTNGSTGSC